MQEYDLLEDHIVLVFLLDIDYGALVANDVHLLVSISLGDDQAGLPDGVRALVDSLGQVNRCEGVHHLECLVKSFDGPELSINFK